MTNTIKLLDRARDLCSPATDYQLAKRLAVSTPRMSQWRRGKSTPDNEVAWKIAKILGMPITDVIAYFEEDRAKNEQKREFWRQQLPRIHPSIAIAGAALGALVGTLIDGHWGSGTAHAASLMLTPLYIMRNSCATLHFPYPTPMG